jgi:hypothetical protein
MAIDPKTNIVQVKQRRYLARDFDSLRATLLDYARQYYPNQIQDFSDSSVGGLFLDMAAYIGDNMSFYMDHLYGEMNYDTAIETNNIERNIINSGINISGASPSIVKVTAYIEVSVKNPDDATPDVSLLPIIKEGTVFSSDSGITFTLTEDIAFAIVPMGGSSYILNPAVDMTIAKVVDGQVISYYLSLDGLCISGKEYTETFSMGGFIPFRQINLSNNNVTEIISVYDDFGNVYYEVGALSHDVVYKNVLNSSSDSSLVKDGLRVIPAPYRFIKTVSIDTRSTTLTMGGGNANTVEDDAIPDPSDFAISFPYSKTISRLPINPEQLLKTSTLGLSSSDSILTVKYRAGGGLSHNVAVGSIKTISSLNIIFPLNPTNSASSKVRNTLEVSNREIASGGENAMTVNQLLALVPNIKNSQERMVTKEDLLARIYTMPANFGRVFRAAIASNPHNPLSTQVYIISRDNSSRLILSPDTLKVNIKKYLNSYRMISDAIDILDARVVNLQLKFTVVLDPSLNKSTILSEILTKLKNQFKLTQMYIDQPIIISNVVNSIFTVSGVVAVDNVSFVNVYGTVNNLAYSDVIHDVKSYTKRQILFPPPGGIFEIRYPDVDIISKVVN